MVVRPYYEQTESAVFCVFYGLNAYLRILLFTVIADALWSNPKAEAMTGQPS